MIAAVRRLPRLPVGGMAPAPSAVLLQLDAVPVVHFVFDRGVVATLALPARESDLWSVIGLGHRGSPFLRAGTALYDRPDRSSFRRARNAGSEPHVDLVKAQPDLRREPRVFLQYCSLRDLDLEIGSVIEETNVDRP